jgi:hypothetical protein
VFAFGLLDPEKKKSKNIRYIKEKNVSNKALSHIRMYQTPNRRQKRF